jgi:hypothetical protein
VSVFFPENLKYPLPRYGEHPPDLLKRQAGLPQSPDFFPVYPASCTIAKAAATSSSTRDQAGAAQGLLFSAVALTEPQVTSLLALAVRFQCDQAPEALSG